MYPQITIVLVKIADDNQLVWGYSGGLPWPWNKNQIIFCIAFFHVRAYSSSIIGQWVIYSYTMLSNVSHRHQFKHVNDVWFSTIENNKQPCFVWQRCSIFITIVNKTSKTYVAPWCYKWVVGWMDGWMDWISQGGVKYRAPFGANNLRLTVFLSSN